MNHQNLPVRRFGCLKILTNNKIRAYHHSAIPLGGNVFRSV
jgi:hypothetical protein